MEQTKIIKISKEQWDATNSDYKGIWQNYHNDHPEWIGKRTIMSTCITNNPNELCKLWIEDVHFIITD